MTRITLNLMLLFLMITAFSCTKDNKANLSESTPYTTHFDYPINNFSGPSTDDSIQAYLHDYCIEIEGLLNGSVPIDTLDYYLNEINTNPSDSLYYSNLFAVNHFQNYSGYISSMHKLSIYINANYSNQPDSILLEVIKNAYLTNVHAVSNYSTGIEQRQDPCKDYKDCIGTAKNTAYNTGRNVVLSSIAAGLFGGGAPGFAIVMTGGALLMLDQYEIVKKACCNTAAKQNKCCES
ncbi:MAG TPA: hypothetical protein PKA44_10425 [Saprospiraceae bacterium]|jgi:hypothetical protein|nr:hypothetical protein [Saprospiraceae bacterium]HQU95474.1 hypothetical protein [Saprospiraceae bacterium]HQW95863.1 hypothetical protein [Saprospiraceae bacterium]